MGTARWNVAGCAVIRVEVGLLIYLIYVHSHTVQCNNKYFLLFLYYYRLKFLDSCLFTYKCCHLIDFVIQGILKLSTHILRQFSGSNTNIYIAIKKCPVTYKVAIFFNVNNTHEQIV